MKMQHNYFIDLLVMGVHCYDEGMLKRRYRQLSKQTHPDTNTGSTEKFKQLKDAYDNLKQASSADQKLLSNLNKSQFAYALFNANELLDKQRVLTEYTNLQRIPLADDSIELLSACYNYLRVKSETQAVSFILADDVYKGVIT